MKRPIQLTNVKHIPKTAIQLSDFENTLKAPIQSLPITETSTLSHHVRRLVETEIDTRKEDVGLSPIRKENRPLQCLELKKRKAGFGHKIGLHALMRITQQSHLRRRVGSDQKQDRECVYSLSASLQKTTRSIPFQLRANQTEISLIEEITGIGFFRSGSLHFLTSGSRQKRQIPNHKKTAEISPKRGDAECRAIHPNLKREESNMNQNTSIIQHTSEDVISEGRRLNFTGKAYGVFPEGRRLFLPDLWQIGAELISSLSRVFAQKSSLFGTLDTHKSDEWLSEIDLPYAPELT